MSKKILSDDKPFSMTLRLPTPMIQEIRGRAKAEMLSVAEFIRRAIFDRLRATKK